MTARPGRSMGPVAVLGAGPAGLTAADGLARLGVPVSVYEGEAHLGGLARTVEYKGYRFDIGGHRFFTASEPVERLWKEILGDALLTRVRRSRILYRRTLFNYPLRPVNTLLGLGPVESLRILASYAFGRLRPFRPEVSFEDWVVNRFGRRLYEIFFKSYTEKVWGIPCSSIGAQWAAQRIRGLSLRTALAGMLFPSRRNRPKTLIEAFQYPRLGPGVMWEAMDRRIRDHGGRVLTGRKVETLKHDGRRILSIGVRDANGLHRALADAFVSSIPLQVLTRALDPPPPPEVLRAADALRYRGFITAALIVDRPAVFPDMWLYIHDGSVRLGRIQNFKNWSPDMVPDPSKTCLGLEYFCSEGGELWSLSDADLLSMAAAELEEIGLAKRSEIADGAVARFSHAYPIYDGAFPAAMSVLRTYFTGFENLQVIGRSGMHRYNNMDHAVLTGLLAVRNLMGERHDLWAADADDETTYSLEGELD